MIQLTYVNVGFQGTLMKKLLNVLSSDLTLIRFLMGVLAFILALGFFGSNTDNNNYQQLNNFADKRIWGLAFVAHAISLMLVVFNNFPITFRRGLHLIGIWLWTYVFLSFTLYDSTPIASTEWMLLMPVILEFWLLTEDIFEKNK